MVFFNQATDTQVGNDIAYNFDSIYVCPPDVSITKTGPAAAKPGTSDPLTNINITYTLTAKNETTTPAAGVVVTDTLPAGTTFVSADNGGTYSAGTGKVTWTVGALAGSASKVLSLTLTPPDAAAVTAGNKTLTNTASVTATSDGNSSNNSAQAVTQMVLTEVLKRVRNVTADERQAPVVENFGVTGGGKPGEVLEYCLTFRNLGGVQLGNYGLLDAVPQNVSALTAVTAYSGQAIRLTRGGTGTAGSPAVTGGTTTYPTAVSTDSDQGSLSTSGGTSGQGALSINLNTPLPVGITGQACFRGTIR